MIYLSSSIMLFDRAAVRVCGLGGRGTIEAGSESWVVAQKSVARYDREENTEKCVVCEEIAGGFGEKSDEDEGSIQRKDRYFDENRHVCFFFDI